MPRTKQKAIVKWIRINRTGFLFEEVFREKCIPIDGAFTPKNFAGPFLQSSAALLDKLKMLTDEL